MNINQEFRNRAPLKFRKVLAASTFMLLLLLAPGVVLSQEYKVLHSFHLSGSDGDGPFAGVVLAGTNLYGTTVNGGAGYGTLFKINTDGSGFTVLRAFSGADGKTSYGNLAISDTTLYGTTYGDGFSCYGSVFSINTDGSGYSVLRQFTSNDGSYPGYAELALANGTLYGMTWGNFYYSSNSTIFKLNIDGSGYSVLRQFAGSPADASWTYSSLLPLGTELYGTTTYGGLFGNGTVFKVNIDGSGFALLHDFGPDGSYPYAGLVAASDGTLYGTTTGGGVFTDGVWGGTAFKINTNGSGFTVLRRFTGPDGMQPRAPLALAGSILYGTTYGIYNGSNLGTVFKLNTDGTGFAVLKHFTGGDGANPQAGVVLSGDTLFGTTDYGGTAGHGVVFSLTFPVPPTITQPPQSQSAEMGATVSLGARVTGSSPLSCQWFFNGSPLTKFTTPAFEIASVWPSNSGAYALVITNGVGAATSAPAMLNVIRPVERRPVPALALIGSAGTWLHVDYKEALDPQQNWLALDCAPLTNSPQFCFDLSAPLPTERFYRAWHTNAIGPPPELDLSIVPAITLTGAIGDSVRVDYINVMGPTDAWVTLDTVLLTNTSQFYFDVSAPNQPKRLYRLLPLP